LKLKTDIKNVDKIIHLSDIQIRLLKRHQEYEEVFQKLYNSIEEVKTENTIICLLGDIVHSKTDMSPELVSIASNFFKKLSALCPLVIVPGNHDANLKNLQRLDAISPIVESINSDRIYYLKNSGTFDFANLALVHMSVFDDYKNYIKAKDVKGKFKVALFHGTVDDSVNDFGYKLKNENIKTSFFNGYDLVLLGDIHAHQYFGEKMAYCGSLIQQNHGESINKHGYILWDLQKNNSKLIEINNNYGFYTINIEDGIIPEIDNIPNKCKVRINFNNTNIEEEQTIISIIKEKYNPIEITKNRIIKAKDNVKVDENKIEIFNIQDVSYQNELIEKYLNKNHDLDEKIIDKIKEINIDTNKDIIHEDVVRNIRWKPNKFTWSNMFSYGENNGIDFSNLRGIIGLLGENASGKTSMIDSFAFCLYDKTSRESSPIDILNNRSKAFECELQFELANSNYFINRNCKKRKKKNDYNIEYKVDFWKDNRDDESNNLNGINRWDTNKNINNLIGSFEDFGLTSFHMQNKNANFVDIGHSKRKDLIIQFIGVNIFDKLLDVSGEKFKTISNDIKSLQKENYDDIISELEDNLEIKTKQYDELILKENNNKEELSRTSKKIDKIKKNIINIDLKLDLNDLISTNKKLYETIKEYDNDINKLTIELNTVQENINKERSELLTFHSIDIEKMYEELEELRNKIDNLTNEKEKLEIILKNKKDKLEKLGKLEYDPNCWYCMNNIFVKDAIQTQKEIEKDENHLSELDMQIESLTHIIESKDNIEKQYEKYTELKDNIEKFDNEVNNIMNKLNSIQIKKQSTTNEVKTNNADIKKYRDSKNIIEKNNEFEKEINLLEEEKNKIDKDLNDIVSNKLLIYGELQVIQSNLSKNIKSKNDLLDLMIEYDCYKYYLEAIKRDGIPHEIINEIIPMLEFEINNTLNQIVDFSILINSDDKDINMFLVYSEDKIWPLELASGMEKFISSIAIRNALTKISNLPRPNFLIIDEGFGTLDSDNLNSISMLFDYLKTQFDFVLIISHVDQLRDCVDSLIDISTHDGFSSIKYPI